MNDKFDSQFDRVFSNAEKIQKRAGTIVGVLFVVNLVIGLGILAGVVWVAHHFISKYW